jgi:hypothetical protein
LNSKCGLAGADVILGMIPLARELLRMGAEVIMVANVKPAINDITAGELRTVVREVCADDPVIKVRPLPPSLSPCHFFYHSGF